MQISKSSAFFWVTGSWWDMPIFVPCVHRHAFLKLSKSQLALSYISQGSLWFWKSQSILVQSLSGLPRGLSSQRLDWASFFFFLLFLMPKVCSFIGLGFFLLILSGPWLVDWVLPIFESHFRLRFQHLWYFGPLLSRTKLKKIR